MLFYYRDNFIGITPLCYQATQNEEKRRNIFKIADNLENHTHHILFQWSDVVIGPYDRNTQQGKTEEL